MNHFVFVITAKINENIGEDEMEDLNITFDEFDGDDEEIDGVSFHSCVAYPMSQAACNLIFWAAHKLL